MTQGKIRAVLFGTAVAMAAATPAFGGGHWKVEVTALGTTVSDGETAFRAPDKKSGKRMAKILNKATEGDGFKAEDSGPCADPLPCRALTQVERYHDPR